MSKHKPLYIRIDALTDLLLAHLVEQEDSDKSKVVRKAIYYYALSHVNDEEFTSLVQLASDCERL